MTRHLIRSPAARARLRAVAPFAEHDAIQYQLTRLYSLAADSPHVFGSPLGPFALRKAHYHLPRFVYFGPQSSDDSVRLVFQAGLDGRDTRAVRALARFVERLALTPDLGHGLNLSFLPLLNPSGVEFNTRENAHGRDLAAENWEVSHEPEITLLRQDAYTRGYHGFVRLETAEVAAITALVRQPGRAVMSSVPALIAAEATDQFPLRWERDLTKPTSGPLTIADDFSVQPFELILRFPAAWTDEVHREAVMQVLKRFIVRYRATLSYGLNL